MRTRGPVADRWFSAGPDPVLRRATRVLTGVYTGATSEAACHRSRTADVFADDLTPLVPDE